MLANVNYCWQPPNGTSYFSSLGYFYAQSRYGKCVTYFNGIYATQGRYLNTSYERTTDGKETLKASEAGKVPRQCHVE